MLGVRHHHNLGPDRTATGAFLFAVVVFWRAAAPEALTLLGVAAPGGPLPQAGEGTVKSAVIAGNPQGGIAKRIPPSGRVESVP